MKTQYELDISSLKLYSASTMKLSAPIALLLDGGALATKCGDGQRKQPDFVVILTDDQDKPTLLTDYQPALQKHFAKQKLIITCTACSTTSGLSRLYVRQ